MIAGNVLGGRLADRRLVPALLGTLAALAVVLGLMTFALHSKVGAVIFTGLLGAAMFATVAGLSLAVLSIRLDNGHREFRDGVSFSR